MNGFSADVAVTSRVEDLIPVVVDPDLPEFRPEECKTFHDITRFCHEKAVREMAADLLKLYARRQANPGFAFASDTPWQSELEASFLYQDTPDQATASFETKQDMQAPKPMDRLICGDVGFGKTEVAMRASFKAVMEFLPSSFDAEECIQVIIRTTDNSELEKQLEEAMHADEAFISAASSYVLPVVKIDDQEISSGKPGELTRHLRQIYIDYARASLL